MESKFKKIFWETGKKDGENKLFCKQCDYHSKRQYYLMRHEFTMHGKERYSCDKCDKTFNQNSNLKEHSSTAQNISEMV